MIQKIFFRSIALSIKPHNHKVIKWSMVYTVATLSKVIYVLFQNTLSKIPNWSPYIFTLDLKVRAG